MTGSEPTPHTVYVHIGLHKTGTTYLQNLMRVNRGALLDQGLEYLAEGAGGTQKNATRDLLGRSTRRYFDPRIPGAWQAMVTGIRERGRPRVLISDESLSMCGPKHARKVVDSFPGAEVHVIATVRDLGRVVVSQWQEAVKSDRTWTWRAYVDGIRDTSNPDIAPARGFWARQNLTSILGAWDGVVPAERVHVVTVPPPGTPPETLLLRFADTVGFDASTLTKQPKWNNETVGVAGVEVLRRVNERMGGRLNEHAYSRVIKRQLVRVLASRPESARMRLPEAEVGWVTEVADEMIATVGARGYAVTGDLEDLRVRGTGSGRDPDDFSDDEVLAAALDALDAVCDDADRAAWTRRREGLEAQGGPALLDAALDTLAAVSEAQAEAWWAGRKQEIEGADAKATGVSRLARGLRVRAVETALAAADKSPAAARAVRKLAGGKGRVPPQAGKPDADDD